MLDLSFLKADPAQDAAAVARFATFTTQWEGLSLQAAIEREPDDVGNFMLGLLASSQENRALVVTALSNHHISWALAGKKLENNVTSWAGVLLDMLTREERSTIIIEVLPHTMRIAAESGAKLKVMEAAARAQGIDLNP